jgi:hypothetical protein
LITLISTAPEPLQKNYIGRLHGNRSMARGYIDALSYAKTIGFDVDRYVPVYGPLLERLKSDKLAFARFSVAHAEELRAERDAENRSNAHGRKRGAVTPSFRHRTANRSKPSS